MMMQITHNDDADNNENTTLNIMMQITHMMITIMMMQITHNDNDNDDANNNRQAEHMKTQRCPRYMCIHIYFGIFLSI